MMASYCQIWRAIVISEAVSKAEVELAPLVMMRMP
jgi:hypothetical protein